MTKYLHIHSRVVQFSVFWRFYSVRREQEIKNYCFGETNDTRFYLIYEPTLEFLESNKSALNGERAEQVAKACKATGKKAYVYAPQKFISQKELTSLGITFCQLPYNIHRIADI